MIALVDQVADWLGLAPFTYLAITIVAILVWMLFDLSGNPAVAGRGVWIRRAVLLVAGVSAVLFAFTAPTLK